MDACKNKTKCEGGDELEVQGQGSDEQVIKNRGGCGAQQPKLRIEGMQMISEYKAQKRKNDTQEQLPEPVERKQQLSAEKVSCYEFIMIWLFLSLFPLWVFPLMELFFDYISNIGLHAYQVLSVLKRISDEDCQLLGLDPKFARPDWMILQVLPIPPPPMRPSVMMDTSRRSEASHFLLCSAFFWGSRISFLFSLSIYKITR